MLFAARMQLVFRLRLLATIACLLILPAAVSAQSSGTDQPFEPRYPPGSTSGREEVINRLRGELARLRGQAPALEPPYAGTPEISRLANRIVTSGRLLEELRRYKPEQSLIDVSLEHLTLPAQQLTYRECYIAADLYGNLFRLVHDDRKAIFGSKAVEHLKQYVKLATVREKVWTKLKAEGIPVGTERDSTGWLRERPGRGLTLFEYHRGFYCVHLWYAGGHRYTSFVVNTKGSLEFVTTEVAARIVEDALGQPRTTDEAVRFLREVLRAFPYDSKVVCSVQDVPPPRFDTFSEKHVAHERAQWDTFVHGPGRSIAQPSRSKTRGDTVYTIYVYQRLGGQVIRFRVRCSSVRPVAIQEEAIADWVGDRWGIM